MQLSIEWKMGLAVLVALFLFIFMLLGYFLFEMPEILFVAPILLSLCCAGYYTLYYIQETKNKAKYYFLILILGPSAWFGAIIAHCRLIYKF